MGRAQRRKVRRRFNRMVGQHRSPSLVLDGVECHPSSPWYGKIVDGKAFVCPALAQRPRPFEFVDYRQLTAPGTSLNFNEVYASNLKDIVRGLGIVCPVIPKTSEAPHG